MNKPLFRRQALLHQKKSLWGSLPHSRLISLGLFTSCLLLITAVVLVFLSINDYQRKESVKGHLVFREGVTLVSTGSPGRISSMGVTVGDWVQSGDALFIQQTDERFDGEEFFSDALMDSLTERELFLTRQIELENEVLRLRQAQNRHQLQSLTARIQSLERMIDTETSLANLKKSAFDRLSSLSAHNISVLELEQAHEAHLQQQRSLQSLMLRQAELLEDKQAMQDSLAINITETDQRLNQFEQELSGIREQQIRARYLADNIVLAPVSGQVSAVISKSGDTVDPGEPVIAISPEVAVLEAELFVPSSAIGFLKTGQAVNLSYEAYPYQKFGMQIGYVESISRQVMLPGELPHAIRTDQPVFQVRVSLLKQTVRAFGEDLNLRSGMLLEASILIESRSLLQWLLEPLYSVTGNNRV